MNNDRRYDMMEHIIIACCYDSRAIDTRFFKKEGESKAVMKEYSAFRDRQGQEEKKGIKYEKEK